MEAMISYFIRSVCISALLLAYYVLLLRDSRHHRFNRFYLVLCFLTSLVVPLLSLPGESNLPQQFLSAVSLTKLISNTAVQHFNTIPSLVPRLFLLVGIVLAGMTLFKIIRIVHLKQRCVSQKSETYYLIYTDHKNAPFSFFHWLFWNKGLEIDNEVGQRILQHEAAHIRFGHSYDKLAVQFCCCICWFNPFFWILKKELSIVHEYMADEACLDDGDTQGFAQMLLGVYLHKHQLEPAHHLGQSPVKRRMDMLAKQGSGKKLSAKAMATLPLLMVVFAFANCKTTRNIDLTLLKLKLDAYQAWKLSHLDSIAIKEKLKLVQLHQGRSR